MDLTKEEVEKVFKELFKDIPYIGPIGDGWYKLGENAYCGEEGYKLFLKTLDEWKDQD